LAQHDLRNRLVCIVGELAGVNQVKVEKENKIQKVSYELSSKEKV